MMFVSFNDNLTGVTGGAGTVYPSGAFVFTFVIFVDFVFLTLLFSRFILYIYHCYFILVDVTLSNLNLLYPKFQLSTRFLGYISISTFIIEFA